MAIINFLEKYQSATKRDYVQRVVEHDKAKCANVAKQWGYDYWDGDRCYGYGGYSYDGRWLPIAEEIIAKYDLKSGDRVLDIGCGKGFLLYELTRALPGLEVYGLDISAYGIEHAKPEIQDRLILGNCTSLPWEDDFFDFVFSINTFHNLKYVDLLNSILQMERVGKRHKWFCVESYRNESEKVNLLYWQLTCMSFYATEEWEWLAAKAGYTGDIGFIFFE